MSVVATAIFCLTVALRVFHIARAYDVFLDESIYSRIADGAALNGKLFFGAYPFYLHGPLSFYWQAAIIRLFGITGTAVHVIDQLRLSNALAGGVIAVTLYSIVNRVSSRTAAVTAALLFALDPFIVSYDSRLFIEPFVSMWVVLGYRVMLPLAVGDVDQTAPRPRRRAYLLGFFFGLALLSKETSAALYVLPLFWCLLRGRPVSRSVAWRALFAMIVTYAPYPIVACATGGTGQFVSQKFGGIERMLGIVQATGYNRAGAPSLFSRLTADLHTFLITYLMIGLGFFAVIYLCRKGNRGERFIGLWGAAAFLLLAFQIAQGTLEEQMFYYLVVPSIVVVCGAGDRLISSGPRRRVLGSATGFLLLLVAAFDSSQWIEVHFGRDAAVAETVSWIDGHVPAGSRIAPLADGIQFLLPNYRILFNPETGHVSVRDLRLANTQIVVTSSLQVAQGYSAATPQLITWLQHHARRRFSVTGATAGMVVVWQMAGHLPSAAPAGAEMLRPSAPISIGARTYGHADGNGNGNG